MALIAASPSPYWFITRGTGSVALVLLTLSVALGVADVRRSRIRDLPRFVLDALHRNSALLAVAFLIVHIVTTLLDGFAPIGLLDVVIPLHSAYRPVWLGLGAVAFDLLAAVTVTSLVRHWFGYRRWRAVHWLAYACWPLALIHGYGTGSDARTHWMLVLSGACVAAVLAAVVLRVRSGWPAHLPVRVSALGACALLPIGLAAWLPSGPMARGWARRAGTPAAVLAAAHGQVAPAPATTAGRGATASSTRGGKVGTSVSGTLRQGEQPDGSALVDIRLTSANPRLHLLHIRIRGQALAAGGVQMTSSRVSLGPAANPDEYGGRITALSGSTLQARLTGPGESTLLVTARLRLPPGDGAVTGTVTAVPAR